MGKVLKKGAFPRNNTEFAAATNLPPIQWKIDGGIVQCPPVECTDLHEKSFHEQLIFHALKVCLKGQIELISTLNRI